MSWLYMLKEKPAAVSDAGYAGDDESEAEPAEESHGFSHGFQLCRCTRGTQFE